MRATRIGAILLALSGLMSFSAVAADIEAGKAKSAVCASCHGVDGNSSNGTWPILAGQHASYLAKQLREFKAGIRVDPTMQGMAAILTDEDILNVSAYFESQNIKPVPFDGDLVAKGQDIYRGGITETSVAACMSCHSPTGHGNGPAGWPSLKGQHSQYLVKQLKDFSLGNRNNDAGKMMRNVAARMNDKEMNAVAAYISGIQ